MAAPAKPWDQSNAANILNRNIPVSSITGMQDQLVNTDVAFGAGFGGGGFASTITQAPPLPPRPPSANLNSISRFGYSGMNSMTSMYSNNPYSSFSPYSSYSPYSSPFGGYGGMGYRGYSGANYNSDNQFVQLAEDSFRNTFQPIESVVNTVRSVSMMLESTVYSLHSSFQTVIGVADHFAKMRAHMGHFFSLFALFRSFKWLYRKALCLLGIIPDGNVSDIWNEAENSFEKILLDDKQNTKKSRWPVLLFFALLFGTPMLLWKLLMLTVPQPLDHSEWVSGKTDYYVGEVLYDFRAESNREISVKAGQHVKLAPKELQPNVQGWILASADGKNTGLIPFNYVKLMGKIIGSTSKDHKNLDALFEEETLTN